ncbi:MAG: hypothetical protein LUD27_00875 [Clostridia bacterium]|nr:hypothetical protein [Clostridia bacterium]
MAKKTKKTASTEGKERRDTTKFCAFWGIVIAAVVMLLSFIFSLLARLGVTISWLGTATSVCNIVSMVALLVAVGIPAYGYVRGRKKSWKIAFWIAFILYILGIIGVGLSI